MFHAFFSKAHALKKYAELHPKVKEDLSQDLDGVSDNCVSL